jgi:YggT family protein
MIDTLRVAISLLFKFLEGAIFIEVILSWVMPGKSNAFLGFLRIFTEPFMAPGRKIQEKLMPRLMIDFSPIIALFILDILRTVIFSII